mgnify:CR=1 FL=1
MVRAERLGVEQIPELKHYKDSEEAGKSHSVCEAGSCLIPTMSDISITKNASPTPNILLRIALVMIKSLVLRGFSFITSGLGGMEASAMAAKVSIMRFTHNI